MSDQPRTVNQFVEEALDELLEQPWMGLPKIDEAAVPSWAGQESIPDLLADYRQTLRHLQMQWLYQCLTGNDGEPPTPEMSAQCNGRIQVAEAVRRDLLTLLDHGKGGPSDG